MNKKQDIENDTIYKQNINNQFNIFSSKLLIDLFVGFLLIPIFLIILILITQKITDNIPQLAGDAFFYIFIPLSITFLLMGVTSLFFKVNTFLWLLLFTYERSLFSRIAFWSFVSDYILNPKAQSYNVIRKTSIVFIILGIIGLIISLLGIYIAYTL